MTKPAALLSFFKQFSLPVYVSTSVPDDAEMPYLVYAPVFGAYDQGAQSITANLWYNSNENAPDKPQYNEKDVNAKAQEIADALGYTGVRVPCDGGFLWLMQGSPFAQPISDPENPYIKRMYMNITCKFMTAT